MKKIIFLLSILLISNNCLAAGSADGTSKNDLYKSAKKLVLKAKKLEKKNKIDKAKNLKIRIVQEKDWYKLLNI